MRMLRLTNFLVSRKLRTSQHHGQGLGNHLNVRCLDTLLEAIK